MNNVHIIYTQKDLKKYIEETCNAAPIHTLTNITIQQGGYLSHKKPQKHGNNA